MGRTGSIDRERGYNGPFAVVGGVLSRMHLLLLLCVVSIIAVRQIMPKPFLWGDYHSFHFFAGLARLDWIGFAWTGFDYFVIWFFLTNENLPFFYYLFSIVEKSLSTFCDDTPLCDEVGNGRIEMKL